MAGKRREGVGGSDRGNKGLVGCTVKRMEAMGWWAGERKGGRGWWVGWTVGGRRQGDDRAGERKVGVG